MDLLSTVVGGVGKLVDEAVTALTGDERLGDAAGIFTNLATGNLPGAITEGLELLDDLQDRSGAEDDPHPAVPAHPASGCPEWDESPQVEVEVGVAGRGEANLAESAQQAIDVARSARAPADPGVSVDVDVSIGGRGVAGEGGEGAVDVDVRVGWGEPAAPASRSLAAKLREILDDPGLSLEDKISMLLTELLDGLDSEIETTMDRLQAGQAAREQAASKGRGRGARGAGDAPSAADISRLSSELQRLVQRRSQMQSLLSNLMSATHQSAMQTIANIR